MSLQDSTPAHAVPASAGLPAHGVVLTHVAVAKVRSLLEQEAGSNLRLRVGVQAGECSSVVYQLFFDERTLDGDLVVDFDGVEVVVDAASAPYLAGASVDFADTIAKQGFTIDHDFGRRKPGPTGPG